jgi:serine/threonine protein kinase
VEDMQRYERINQLNNEFGEVYLARDTVTNRKVALKRVRMMDHSPIEGDIPANTLREITILRQLHHPNIVELLDVIQHDNSRLYLSFEAMDMDLRRYIHSVDDLLAPEQIRSFTTQMLRGLEYCHARSILHR